MKKYFIDMKYGDFIALLRWLYLALWSFSFLLQAEQCECLKVHEVKVPGYSAKGETIQLECSYDLEGDELYSIKWYKGYKEFFRFVPADNPTVQIFNVHGVLIDGSRSTPQRVILKDVTRDSSGKYKCEASAEAPSFHTDSAIGELLVVDLPDGLPQITGLWKKYHVGDIVHVNCTSARSKPAAALSWYINEKKAEQSYLVEYAPMSDKDGLETSILGLKFQARTDQLRHGHLKLRCTATIASVYFKQNFVRVRTRLVPRKNTFRQHNRLRGNAVTNRIPALLITTLFPVHLIYHCQR